MNQEDMESSKREQRRARPGDKLRRVLTTEGARREREPSRRNRRARACP